MSRQVTSHHGRYTIQHYPAKLFPWESNPYIFRLSSILTWAVWTCYLSAQAIVIHHMDKTSAAVQWSFWAGWFAEICLSSNEFVHGMHIICQLLRSAKVGLRPHYRLLHDEAPTIDVIIPCCGEAVDILVNTVAAAAGQDYPASELRVIVLDDAGDDQLQRAIERLNLTGRLGPKILYRSRKVGGIAVSHFKAGNLRYGIEQTATMGGGEFIAVIDADMIAAVDWLRRMVPHFILDSTLAMLNQPQHYYNVPKNDLLAEQTEFDLWFTIFEPLNDRVGEAMCQGSGFLVRRSALEDIGGWPLAHTGEDVMCSLKFLFKGWKLGYVREYLQHGLTPGSLGARLKQKTRWAADILEFIRTYGFYLTTTTLGALAHRDLTSLPITLGLVILPAALLATAFSPNTTTITSDQFNMIRTLLLLTFVTRKLNDYIIYRHLGLTRLSNYQSLNLWCAPFAAINYIRALLPNAVTPSFFVTGTFTSTINERSRKKRAKLAKRLLSSCVPMYLAYVLCSSAIMAWCLWRFDTSQKTTASSRAGNIGISMLPGPVVTLATCIWKAFVPVLYMIAPPNVPEWKELLERDSKGVLRPKRPTQSLMDPSGSEKDDCGLRLWWDTLEMSVLLCCLWRS